MRIWTETPDGQQWELDGAPTYTAANGDEVAVFEARVHCCGHVECYWCDGRGYRDIEMDGAHADAAWADYLAAKTNAA